MFTRIIMLLLVITTFCLGACSKSRKATSRSNEVATRKTEASIKAKYASTLGVSPAELGNERLYVFIDQWMGAPYKYGGTSTSGVDCSGFVGAVYQGVYEKSIPRTTSQLDQQAKNVTKNQLKEGDLVFFDINGKKSSHVGIYLLNDRFVHASTSKGVVISDLNNPYYQKAFAKGGRL